MKIQLRERQRIRARKLGGHQADPPLHVFDTSQPYPILKISKSKTLFIPSSKFQNYEANFPPKDLENRGLCLKEMIKREIEN